jgi:hypothetical protein
MSKDKGRGLIRSRRRKGARSDKKPLVATKGPAPRDPAVCESCGAVYSRRT